MELRGAEMRKYRIGVVCGAGMATSSVIATKLREELSKKGLDVDIITLKAVDASSSAKNLDLIVTSTLLEADFGIPIIRGISLLTGIGEEETIDEIYKTLLNLNQKH